MTPEISSPGTGKIKKLFKEQKARNYKKGQIILHQDDPLSHVFYLIKGYVKAYNILDGGEQRTVFLFGPNDIFPNIASVEYQSGDKQVLRHYFQTISDAEVSMAPREDFMKSMYKDPAMMMELTNYLAASSREVVEHLEAVKSKNAIDKLVNVLPYLIGKCGRKITKNKYRLVSKIVHQDIADLAGLTRETASVHIKKLEEEGVLKQRRGHWVIFTDKLNNDS